MDTNRQVNYHEEINAIDNGEGIPIKKDMVGLAWEALDLSANLYRNIPSGYYFSPLKKQRIALLISEIENIIYK